MRCAPLLIAAVLLSIGLSDTSEARLHGSLERRFEAAGPGARLKAWVLFRDKGHVSPEALDQALADLEAEYDQHAIARRRARRSRPGLVDLQDLPVSERYVEAVRRSGAEVRVRSRWANSLSVMATRSQLEAIAKKPFIRRIQPVLAGRRMEPGTHPGLGLRASDETPAALHGEAEAQLEQINLVALHDAGYRGAGVRIGVLDTGFRKTHDFFNQSSNPLDIVAEWDFVNDDPDTGIEAGDAPNQHNHGSFILGTLAAYMPDVLVGAAYEASYILAKVEDVSGEYPAEEDFFVAGLEFIEANGGDVATSSVVINGLYTRDQLDGLTSVMAVGIDVASANGVVVMQGIGNSGHDADRTTSSMVPPSDAFMAVTVAPLTMWARSPRSARTDRRRTDA